jgi:PiT family inorganic phosphate transporter
VLIATRVGIPVSTTHSLIGALVGTGLALAPTEVEWAALGGRYFVPLLISPLLAVVAAALIYPFARWLRAVLGIEPTTCVCLPNAEPEPVAVDASGSLLLARTRLPLTVDQAEACSRRYQGRIGGISAQRVLDAAHVGSAFSLGFARGLNDTPKVLALLIAAGWSGIAPQVSLLVVATAMAAGGLLHSRRLATTLGHRITSMNHGQGLVANAVGSVLVIGASLLGSPVSTTHVSTGAIFGIGIWTGSADRRVIGGIVLAWVATLPLGAAIAFVVARSVGLL